jgi:hypothetical protein
MRALALALMTLALTANVAAADDGRFGTDLLPYDPSLPESPFDPGFPQTPYDPGLPESPFDPGFPQTPYDPGLPESPYDPGFPQVPYDPGLPRISAAAVTIYLLNS